MTARTSASSASRPALPRSAYGAVSMGCAIVTRTAAPSCDRAADGGQIAYLTLTRSTQGAAPGPQTIALQGDELRLRWNVADIATGQTRALTTFIPSDAFANLIPFFDQYARSLRVWSPDSRSLVYGVDEGPQSDGIYVVDVAPGATLRRIASGALGVWSTR